MLIPVPVQQCPVADWPIIREDDLLSPEDGGCELAEWVGGRGRGGGGGGGGGVLEARLA